MEKEPNKEVLKQAEIVKLKKIRDSWLDKTPKKVLHSPDEIDKPKHKVRKAWFHVLISTLNDIVFREQLLDNPDLIQRLKDYKKETVDPSFSARLTTKEDIDKANGFIDEIIVELEK